ncbi:MAG: DUF4367 domain-containing protein [Anaerolineae bacterium]|nr:DUF4367 domain-containing protein [Anaerolineae bacterium]
MRKAPTWVVLGLCALAAACLRHRLTGPEVLQLAQQAVYAAEPCHVVLEVEIDTDLVKDTLTVEIWEAPPARLKLVVLQAQSGQFRRLAFATNGDQGTLYSPHAGRVTVGPPELVRLPTVLEPVVAARRGWVTAADAEEARVVGVVRDGGLVLYQVAVPSSRGDAVRFWLDARDWLVREVTYVDDYLGKGTIRVRELQRAAALPDAAFELNVPEDVPVVTQPGGGERFSTFRDAQRVANYRLRQPTYLPAETGLEYGYQVDQDIALVYSGAHPFTLLQGLSGRYASALIGTEATVNGRPAVWARDEAGGRVVLAWREEDLRFSIAGALSRDELLRIAESLE